MTFEIGDVVELVSGGPPMAVTELETPARHPHYIVCLWFHGSGELAHGNFDPATLRLCNGRKIGFNVTGEANEQSSSDS